MDPTQQWYSDPSAETRKKEGERGKKKEKEGETARDIGGTGPKEGEGKRVLQRAYHVSYASHNKYVPHMLSAGCAEEEEEKVSGKTSNRHASHSLVCLSGSMNAVPRALFNTVA